MTAGQPYSTTYREWQPGPRQPRLDLGALHVWQADLASVPDEFRALLSPREHARAERFLRQSSGRVWARSRGVLRELLGRYLDQDPREIRLTTEKHGKPVLRGNRGGSGVSRLATRTHGRLHFNLSHSGGVALYAFTETGPVGIDVQVAGRAIDEVSIATRALGVAEGRRLRALDPEARAHEFLGSWARHEAELKRRGTGIGARAANPRDDSTWSVQIEMGPSVAAAVALGHEPSQLRCWEWRSPEPNA